MKAASSFIKIAQGPSIMVAIYKRGGTAQAVITKQRPLRPVLFRKGRKQCTRQFRSRTAATV